MSARGRCSSNKSSREEKKKKGEKAHLSSSKKVFIGAGRWPNREESDSEPYL